MSNDAVSIRRCEWLLKQRGYRYWREDDISQILPLRNSRPDFLAETPTGIRFFLEVKSFEKETVLHQIRAVVFSLSHMTLQKRVNRLVKDAAKQMREYHTCRLPMVIALDNYRRVGGPLDQHSLGAVFGELGVVQTIDTSTGRAAGTRSEREDDNSPLYGGRNAHVSAVMAVIPTRRFDDVDNTDDFTQERPMRARILRSPFAAIPLPQEVFSSLEDEQLNP